MQQVFPFLETQEEIEPDNRYTIFDLHRYVNSTDYPVISFDIETEGLNPFDSKCQVLTAGLVWKEARTYKGCGLTNRQLQEYKTPLLKLFEKPNVLMVGHTIKFDINWMAVKFGIVCNSQLLDTLILSYLVNENLESNSLDNLIARYCEGEFDAETYSKDKAMRAKIGMFGLNHTLNYNLKDCRATLRLAESLWKRLNPKQQHLAILGSNISKTLSNVERRGCWIDFEFAGDRANRLLQEAYSLRMRINASVGFSVDPASSLELQKALKKLGFQLTALTEAGSLATDNDTLIELKYSHPHSKHLNVLDMILAYRKALKLYSTYYKPLSRMVDNHKRIHTTYYLGKQRGEGSESGTVTGRLSSSGPNLQNSPRDKEFRGMFAAPEGWMLIDGDYSQLEIRVAAYLTRERKLIEAFEKNLDIHTAVMAELEEWDYETLVEALEDKLRPDHQDLKNRRVGVKRINFGILYGIARFRLQALLKYEFGIVWELSKCDHLIKEWLGKYTNVTRWIREVQMFAIRYGYTEQPMGQRRHLPDACHETDLGRSALRQASNFPVQSMASWICLLGMYILDEFLKTLPFEANIVLQVHDSITIEVYTEEKKVLTQVEKCVKMIMQDGVRQVLTEVFGIDFDVPLEFTTNICKRWS